MKSFLSKFAVMLAVLFISLSAFANVAAKADPTPTGAGGVDVNSLFTDDGKGIFKDTTNVAKSAGASARTLVITVAVIFLVIGLIIVGLQFTTRNSAKRQEAKSNLVAIIIGAIIVFGAIGIIAFSQKIAGSLQETLTTEEKSDK
jgi:hypothetical protein